MPGRNKLVVAIDGSDTGYRALQTGATLAKAMGRELEVLYVFPHQSGFSAAYAGIDEQVSREALDQLKESSSREIFHKADAIADIRNKHLLVGDPAEEIVAFMETNPGAHLVMGRRGLSRIKSLVMGSVSSKVVAHTPGLVTVVT